MFHLRIHTETGPRLRAATMADKIWKNEVEMSAQLMRISCPHIPRTANAMHEYQLRFTAIRGPYEAITTWGMEQMILGIYPVQLADRFAFKHMRNIARGGEKPNNRKDKCRTTE